MAISLKDNMAAELAMTPAPVEKKISDVVTPIKSKIEAKPLRDPETVKVTLYLPRKAYRYIRSMAVEIDGKAHTIMLQAIDEFLIKHEGKSIEQLAGGKKK
jgi:hypothetical protein